MKRLALLTVAILFFSAPIVFGQPLGKGMGPDLTQEQAERLQKMNEGYLREISPLQNRLFTKRAEIRLLWEEMNPDRDKIMEKQREALEIQKRLEERAIMHRLDSQSILTPEQRAGMLDCKPSGRWDRGQGRRMHGGW